MIIVVADVDIPNPVDVITHAVAAPAGWAWDKVAEGIGKWVLGAVAYFVDGVVDFLLTSARPNIGAVWFSGAGSPYATVRAIAVALLLAFTFLGILQGLLAGDSTAMMRRVVVDLPAAVLGMVSTTVVVGKLLELTDALSNAVLTNSGGQAVHFLSGFGVAVNGSTQGFAAVLLGLVAVIAGFLVWIELMVRSVLVYILVALSPLSFAAMVWPSARGVLRRTVEMLLAVILSKLVICIAISVGVAALSGAGTSGAGPSGSNGTDAATGMGALFVGTAILAMAAFAPFLVLKLIPWAESAIAAQGVSRGPVRSAQSAMSNVYHAQSLSRLAGGHSGQRALPGSTTWAVGGPASAAGGSASGPPLAAGGGTTAVAAAGAAVVTTAASTTTKSIDSATTAGTASAQPPGSSPRRRRPTDQGPASGDPPDEGEST